MRLTIIAAGLVLSLTGTLPTTPGLITPRNAPAAANPSAARTVTATPEHRDIEGPVERPATADPPIVEVSTTTPVEESASQVLVPPPVAEVWAAVIGIDDYSGSTPDLRSAVGDARSMVAALERLGIDAAHQSVHFDRDATAAGVRAGATWLVDHAGPEDTAVLFYAGHVRVRRSTQVIVGSDGGTVSDVELAALLGPLQAKQAWIVMAACFGGGFTELLAPGRILTAASPADQLSFENLELHASYLGYYLIGQALLEGRADESVQEAFTWSQVQLSTAFPNRLLVQDDRLGRPLDLRRPAA